MMKRIVSYFLPALIVAIGSSALLVGVAQAQIKNIVTNDVYEEVGQQSYQGTENLDLAAIIVRFINFFLSLLGIIFLIIIIYAGFLWMTAGGDDDQVGKAKKLIINSIIGVIIIIAAYAISNFVLESVIEALTQQSV